MMQKNTKKGHAEESPVYRLSKNAAFEAFDDGVLILNLEKVTFTELNPIARDILQATDGKNNLQAVVRALNNEYKISMEIAMQNVIELYHELLKQGIIENINYNKKRMGKMAATDLKVTQFMCNPDVVLREEDEDGGLLFNPDTNQVKVVNTSGLFIWKQFKEVNTSEKVAKVVLNNFGDATPEVVQSDLAEFLQDMLATGFIGEVTQKNDVK